MPLIPALRKQMDLSLRPSWSTVPRQPALPRNRLETKITCFHFNKYPVSQLLK